MTKAVSDRFGKGGIADRVIWFNGFPFLDNKEDHSFGVPVSQVMTTSVTPLPAHGLTLSELERILAENNFQGYPIVENLQNKILVGYIGRTELRYAIERMKREGVVSRDAKCFFSAPTSTHSATTPSVLAPSVTFDTTPATGGQTIDFSRFIEQTPLTVHPRLPLETVMELFKKMGPRVVICEYRGKVVGLVTVKDCLKYQFQVEAAEHPRQEGAGPGEGFEERGAKIWDAMNKVGNWVGAKTGMGRLGLGNIGLSRSEGEEAGNPVESLVAREQRPIGLGVELNSR